MELEGLEKKAKASGASQLVVKDLKEEFVKDFIYPCLRAGAIYERKYLLGTSMARPVIAKVPLPSLSYFQPVFIRCGTADPLRPDCT
jgi:argininosuccinate synthase